MGGRGYKVSVAIDPSALLPTGRSCHRAFDVHHRRENREHGAEFFPVQIAVFLHVIFNFPGVHAGQLTMHRHGATVVGPLQRKGFEDVRVARDEPRTALRACRWQAGCGAQGPAGPALRKALLALIGDGRAQLGYPQYRRVYRHLVEIGCQCRFDGGR